MARDLGRGEAEKAFARDKYKYVLDEPVTLQGWEATPSTSTRPTANR